MPDAPPTRVDIPDWYECEERDLAAEYRAGQRVTHAKAKAS